VWAGVWLGEYTRLFRLVTVPWIPASLLVVDGESHEDGSGDAKPPEPEPRGECRDMKCPSDDDDELLDPAELYRACAGSIEPRRLTALPPRWYAATDDGACVNMPSYRAAQSFSVRIFSHAVSSSC
jgi:hypothetical protein